MNKKLSILRTEQREKLAVLRESLKIAEEMERTAYLNWAKTNNRDDIKSYSTSVMPFVEQVNRVKRDIEYLETELIDKKFANLIGYSDVDPYEVIEERTANCYVIRSMDAVETEQSKHDRLESFIPGGFCGHFDNDVQDWDITSNENGFIIKIRRHKDGCWYDAHGARYNIENAPRKVYDFNF